MQWFLAVRQKNAVIRVERRCKALSRMFGADVCHDAKRTCSSPGCALPRLDGPARDGIWGGGMSGCDGSSSGMIGVSCETYSH